jgi:hypothetical protein
VRGIVGDDRYRRIEALDRRLRERGECAFASWKIEREYTSAEIEKAELFLLRLRYLHATGDEYGTEWPFSPVSAVGYLAAALPCHAGRAGARRGL